MMRWMAVAVMAGLMAPAICLGDSAETQIKAVLDTQVATWNRGDVAAFVETYTTDCIFAGRPQAQGRAQVLERYKKRYPTSAAMGQLSFSNMAVHVLDKNVATVTADWHLERPATDGGPVGGYFSLVLRRESGVWRIALDHTTLVP